MDIILLVSFIAVALLGYKLIDVAFNGAFTYAKVENGPDLKKLENALIFGSKSDNKGLEEIFKDKNIKCTLVEDINDLDTSISYNYLIAVGKSDQDNIIICTIFSKLMGVERLIALCNYSYNEKFYENNHIPYFNSKDMSFGLLTSYLFESISNGRREI